MTLVDGIVSVRTSSSSPLLSALITPFIQDGIYLTRLILAAFATPEERVAVRGRPSTTPAPRRARTMVSKSHSHLKFGLPLGHIRQASYHSFKRLKRTLVRGVSRFDMQPAYWRCCNGKLRQRRCCPADPKDSTSNGVSSWYRSMDNLLVSLQGSAHRPMMRRSSRLDASPRQERNDVLP